ncbi:MAG: hypothetical protein IAE93_13470 [Ignavibacteria bacterium]|nr:hypothetical protein [Ignavibacteria bacterium]
MDKLDKILRTGIWHITSLHGFRGIEKDQFIYPNINNRFKVTYSQTNNSVAKKNNCVSLFDLEDIKDEIYLDSIYTTQRHSIIFAHDPFSIALNLDRNMLPAIIPYDKIENKVGVIIGHMECIYTEPIPFSAIKRILILDDLNYNDFVVMNSNFTYENLRKEVNKMTPARLKKYCENKRKRQLEDKRMYEEILKRRNELENYKIEYGK